MQGYLKFGEWDVYTECHIYVTNPSSPAGPLHRRNVVAPSANLHTTEVTERTCPTTDIYTGAPEHEGSTHLT
jgi:hypothetical protein